MTGQRPGQAPLRPTAAATLAWWVIGGLLAGGLLRPVSERLTDSAPLVTWIQPITLGCAAGALAFVAWQTGKTLTEAGGALEPQHAVNRMVLGRACALAGALLSGGYAGYALTWLGLHTSYAEQRLWRSIVAAVASLAMCLAGWWLERNCRVRGGDSEPGG